MYYWLKYTEKSGWVFFPKNKESIQAWVTLCKCKFITLLSYSVLAHLLTFEQNLLSIS